MTRTDDNLPHRDLVPYVGEPRDDAATSALPGAAVQAVIVPASRPAANLRWAAEVAASAEAHLVVLASHETVPDDVRDVVGRHLGDERIVVAPLDGRWSLPRLTFRTDRVRPRASRFPGADLPPVRTSNTSVKRNAGLALAKLVGWERVLFLDDDVHGIGERDLRVIRHAMSPSAGAHAGGPAGGALEAVGWAFDDFPDNSVVCHAHRLAGGTRDTFIGGGALAVRVTDAVPHFPRVYNEDWLFMLPMMLRRTSTVGLAGTLTQESYDPYAVPRSAARQEFGDVLAEGLFGLLHARRPIETAQRTPFWCQVLAERRRFIQRTRSILAQRDDSVANAAVRALDTALRVDLRISPHDPAGWVRSWRQDSQSWHNYLTAMPTGLAVGTALDWLGLRPAQPRSRRAAEREAA